MPSPNEPRFVRLSPLALTAAVALPLLAVAAMSASGQDFTRDGEPPARTEQEYRILEPTELIFISVERASDFLDVLGNAGWIVPDGTQIIAHVYEPGTSNQHTRFLLRPAGSYDDEIQHVIVRRERR